MSRPGSSAGSPTTAAAPSPPSGAPTPWDVQAANDEAGANKRYSDTLAGIGSRWTLSQQEYGLEGPYANYEANPYSKAAQLQRSYDNAQRGSLNSKAAEGHLYGGSLVNARNSNTNNFNLSYDALQKAYAQVGTQRVADELGARQSLEDALREAQWRRINAALESEPDPVPSGEAGGGGGESGAGAQATVTVKGRRKKIGVSSNKKAR